MIQLDSYYGEVVSLATEYATRGAYDIICELVAGNATIEELLSQDVGDAIYDVTGGDGYEAEVLRDDHYEEIISEVEQGLLDYLKEKL